MKTIADKLGRFLKSPSMNMALGLMLLFVGSMELAETTLEDVLGFEIGAHHGIMLIGLVHGLKGLIEMIEGGREVGPAS